MKPSLKPINLFARLRKWPRWSWAVAFVAASALGWLWFHSRSRGDSESATFAARRGPLNITVLEGGSLRAVESQEIKCEVHVGYQGLKILKIVDEGYEVTPDDIRTNKVLVELDSSDLQKQIVQQDIQFESAAASLTDAQQNYEIQLNQNLSDIKAAEQKARFARMDFDKFLGDKVTQVIVDQLGLEQELATEQTNALARAAAVVASMPNRGESRQTPAASTNSAEPKSALAQVAGATTNRPGPTATATAPATNQSVTPAIATNQPPKLEPVPATPSVVIDFSPYAKIEALGDGEAKQKLRKFEDDLQVARKEQGQAKANLEGTQRLFDKGFVTKIDLEKDEIANENNRLKVQTAVTASDLFLKYEFRKTAEESLSKYAEAVRELVRARKAAISKLAQAEAKLKSAQGQYNIQARQRKDFYEQLDKCTISAKRPGLVVYGGGGDEDYYYGGEERIREGASVRERQSIITIPDMTKMSVRVKILESYIKKVKKGQLARITVDAFPDTVLEGEVSKVGVLPDSQNRWMNPDMKVYLTTITIRGTNDWLKPGMSAKVEILANCLSNVVYVPVQAVSPLEGKQVCYVANGRKPECRTVEVGEFNDEFIEIKSGIKEGERVLLRAVESQAPEKTEEKPQPSPAGKAAPKPAAPPATAAAAPKTKA
jgi:multidrug resistance efflux pump